MKDKICNMLAYLVVGTVWLAFGIFISVTCLFLARIFYDSLVPEGLSKSGDLFIHEWYIVDESVGLYSGYEVYCPACGESRTCSVSQWHQYLIDKEYAERIGGADGK